MFDITLTENIYKFLSDLETDGFIAKEINIKVVNKLRTKNYYKKYDNLLDFFNQNKTILQDTSPSRYCTVGDFPFIENIKFTNTVSNYFSEFYYYNITSRNPKIRNKVQYDSKRNDFYEFDISKYIEYLKQNLLLNLQRNISLTNIRLNSYVDACYVDTNYVEENVNPVDSIENNF
jgi:hypothetical protein